MYIHACIIGLNPAPQTSTCCVAAGQRPDEVALSGSWSSRRLNLAVRATISERLTEFWRQRGSVDSQAPLLQTYRWRKQSVYRVAGTVLLSEAPLYDW